MNDCDNCNEKNICEVKEMMNLYGFHCKAFTPYKPPTISDRLRDVTDEKLARFLWQVQTGLRSAQSEESWLKWLNNIYKEEQHND